MSVMTEEGIDNEYDMLMERINTGKITHICGQPVAHIVYDTYRFTNSLLPQHSFTVQTNHPLHAFKMSPEKKQLWLDGLKGRKQVRRHLCSTDTENGEFGYCCLGVYAEVRGIPSILLVYLGETTKKYYVFKDENDGDDISTSMLAGALKHEVTDSTHQEFLASLNDAGWSFEDISKVIEVCF